jgi:hypothetical protein
MTQPSDSSEFTEDLSPNPANGNDLGERYESEAHHEEASYGEANYDGACYEIQEQYDLAAGYEIAARYDNRTAHDLSERIDISAQWPQHTDANTYGHGPMAHGHSPGLHLAYPSQANPRNMPSTETRQGTSPRSSLALVSRTAMAPNPPDSPAPHPEANHSATAHLAASVQDQRPSLNRMILDALASLQETVDKDYVTAREVKDHIAEAHQLQYPIQTIIVVLNRFTQRGLVHRVTYAGEEVRQRYGYYLSQASHEAHELRVLNRFQALADEFFDGACHQALHALALMLAPLEASPLSAPQATSSCCHHHPHHAKEASLISSVADST